MFLGHRQSDPVIIIRQNNGARAVEIVEINPGTEELLGWRNADVAGKTLESILPARITSLLNEYVEYEQDGNDVGNVLGKVQSFCAMDNKGREIGFRLKVLRSEALDRNQHFRLILQDGQGPRRTEAFRSVLRENFKGHEVLDEHTGLPDRGSLAKDLEFTLFYVHKGELSASFAMIELDDFANFMVRYGVQGVTGMMRHIADLARQNLRADDTIGAVDLKRLGLILFDTTPESARMVLNRLRWLAAANPYKNGSVEVPLTVSICFSSMGTRVHDKNILSDLEYYLDEHKAGASNALIEVGEVDKRKPGRDRRKLSIAVPFERRKGERRGV